MFVIVPDEKAERRFANITNVSRRHCRIGKVMPKHWGNRIFWKAGFAEAKLPALSVGK